MWAYKRGGVTLPHLASGQAATLRHKDFSDKQPGDLIFYGIVPHHVAMYVGDNTVVEAPDVGIPVRRRTLQYDSTDRQNYVGAFPARATTSPNPVNAGNTTQTGNRGLAQIMAASYGWVGDQWSTLQKLWDRESGFNNYAKNPTSGAYGIAQALPESKYPYAGTEAGGSSARAQISWGLSYIKTRYGTPAAAWSHEQSAGWY
jgi:cell wall-associated NlpC family hydrolase